jgi:tellurite resistance protein TehA-like permease
MFPSPMAGRIMYLGKATAELFSNSDIHIVLRFAATGTHPDLDLDMVMCTIIYITTLVAGLIMWSFGFVWMGFALSSIYRSRPFPFNMGWWGFTFPLGVYSACTIQLGLELQSMALKILGTVGSLYFSPT